VGRGGGGGEETAARAAAGGGGEGLGRGRVSPSHHDEEDERRDCFVCIVNKFYQLFVSLINCIVNKLYHIVFFFIFEVVCIVNKFYQLLS
jgi:hypothetical protein